MAQTRPARFTNRSDKAGNGLARPSEFCEDAAAQVVGLTLAKRTVAALGRMVPARQAAAIRIMVAANNLSGDFARALLAATPAGERTDDARGRQSHPDCVSRLARIERELAQMQINAAGRRSRYEDDLVYLALTASFVRGWMNNAVVAAWLESHHSEFAGVLGRLATDSDFAIESERVMKLPYAVAGSKVKACKKG